MMTANTFPKKPKRPSKGSYFEYRRKSDRLMKGTESLVTYQRLLSATTVWLSIMLGV